MGYKEADLGPVVCTKLSAGDARFLKTYARSCYIANIIAQPTMSHVLRHIVKEHRKLVADKDKTEPSNLLQSGSSISNPNPRDTESADKFVRMVKDKLRYPIPQNVVPLINKRRATESSKIVDTQNSPKPEAEEVIIEEAADEE